MRLLLDTHIFLWYIASDRRLSPVYANAIGDAGNDVFLSVVSLWEAIVKYRTGKLFFPASPEIYLTQLRQKHGIRSLPIEEADVARLISLPLLHRDPFDRMLICQAQEHALTLVTDDAVIAPYPVSLLTG
jgi:PIN domain nuclease of toxin-antitoxin system